MTHVEANIPHKSYRMSRKNMNHGTESVPLVWPEQEYDRVPYRLYTDRKLFDVEMQRIFGEKSWSYAGLSCELAEPGAYPPANVEAPKPSREKIIEEAKDRAVCPMGRSL